MSDLESLVSAAQADFAAAATPADLENAKARYLGKAGRVTELLKSLGALSVEQKKSRGAEINATKQRIEAAKLTVGRTTEETSAELKAGTSSTVIPSNVFDTPFIGLSPGLRAAVAAVRGPARRGFGPELDSILESAAWPIPN